MATATATAATPAASSPSSQVYDFDAVQYHRNDNENELSDADEEEQELLPPPMSWFDNDRITQQQMESGNCSSLIVSEERIQDRGIEGEHEEAMQSFASFPSSASISMPTSTFGSASTSNFFQPPLSQSRQVYPEETRHEINEFEPLFSSMSHSGGSDSAAGANNINSSFFVDPTMPMSTGPGNSSSSFFVDASMPMSISPPPLSTDGTQSGTTTTTTTTTNTTTTTGYDQNHKEQHFQNNSNHHKQHRQNQNLLSTAMIIGSPHPSPSWKEISFEVLPTAARELLTTSFVRICHTARLSYARGRWHRKFSDFGNNSTGFFRATLPCGTNLSEVDLPPFSSLSWVDRQLVQEWRTYFEDEANNNDNSNNPDQNSSDEDMDFQRARTLVPTPHKRPKWLKAEVCFDCHKPFGPTRLRHHCRLCGKSFCQKHSSSTHRLPHLGYDPHVPERVCDECKRTLLNQNLAERVAWRLARCRDLQQSNLTPYFEIGVDTVEQVALRITHAALALAKSIPLGAQAHVAVETVDVLRKYGLNGIYGIMLRKEFLAAADLLRQVLGINESAWPLSVHELSAAIFYALAQHRAIRGMNPDREEDTHKIRQPEPNSTNENKQQSNDLMNTNTTNITDKAATIASEPLIADSNLVIDQTDNIYDLNAEKELAMAAISTSNDGSKVNRSNPIGANKDPPSSPAFQPVCDYVPDTTLASLVFYAPIALNFIYQTTEVDMQLLAAQQGWRLLYAYLPHTPGGSNLDGHVAADTPASAVFVHEEQKIACLAIRGTATIHDVVIDIRQMPVAFPEPTTDQTTAAADDPAHVIENDWTTVAQGQGFAVCGMAAAAVNLYREHSDVLLTLVQQGYRIRITGHSLGGGVATLLGVMILKDLEELEKQKMMQEEQEELHSGGEQDCNEAKNNVNKNNSSQCGTDYNRGAVENRVIKSHLLRVYAYGSPSCVDGNLSEFSKTFVTTAVLHDDVVPRLTPASCRGLLKHLLHIRETWVKTHLTDDLMAITERARSAWAPRWRGSFTLMSSTKIKRYCRKQIRNGKNKLLSVKETLVGGDDTNDDEEEQPCDNVVEEQQQSWADRVQNKSGVTSSSAGTTTAANNLHISYSGAMAKDDADIKLLPDYMGGIDKRTEVMVIDGEQYFDADESLLETEEENLSSLSPLNNSFLDALGSASISRLQQEEHHFPPLVEEDSWSVASHNENNCFEFHATKPNHKTESKAPSIAPVPTAASHSASPPTSSDNGSDGGVDLEEEEDNASVVMLEEIPLPRMFIPGNIVHIYAHRGLYKVAYVPKTFWELRRISLAGNMLSDHTTKAYYDALTEVRHVRSAAESAPKWTAFDEDDTCSCCASRFTWASTSDSEAQEARDKHNCRSCGALVCDPCSKNLIPLPSIGLAVASRVCDRCYNDIGGLTTASNKLSAMTCSCYEAQFENSGDQGPNKTNNNETLASGTLSSSSLGSLFTSANTERPECNNISSSPARPERQREKRSRVVDELASRVRGGSAFKSS